MNRLRILLTTIRASRPILVGSKNVIPSRIQKVYHHYDGPPQPFDNMPFDIPNRYVATVFFAFFFGIGFWFPFLLVWYFMAKKTM